MAQKPQQPSDVKQEPKQQEMFPEAKPDPRGEEVRPGVFVSEGTEEDHGIPAVQRYIPATPKKTTTLAGGVKVEEF